MQHLQNLKVLEIRLARTPMGLLALLALTATVWVLQASAQETVRQDAIVLRDTCLAEDELSSRAVDKDITDTLSNIASELSGERSK